MATTTERRQQERTEVALDAWIERISGRPLRGTASTLDISPGGSRLLGPGGFAVGDVVRVTIGKGDVTIERQALVVGRQERSSKQAVFNLAFKIVDAHAPDDLQRVLTAAT